MQKSSLNRRADGVSFSDRVRHRRQRGSRAALLSLAAAAGLAMVPYVATAATYTWDSGGNPANGATDGAGIWITSSTDLADWYDGSTDVVWPNDYSTAVFGASASGAGGGVTIAAGSPLQHFGGLTFNQQASGKSYSIVTNGALTFGESSGIIQNNNTAANTTVGKFSAFNGMTFSGSGTTSLTGTAYSIFGGINVSDGSVLTNVTAYGLGPSGANVINLNNSGKATFGSPYGSMTGGLIGGTTSVYATNNGATYYTLGLNTAAGTDDVFQGAQTNSNTESFSKWGMGSQTFTGAGGTIFTGTISGNYVNPVTHTYFTSPLSPLINSGTVVLDHTSSIATPIVIGNSRGSFLTLDGGTLSQVGKTNTATNDSINFQFGAGASGITITNGGGGSAIADNNSFTENTGGTILYTMPSGTPSSTNGFYVSNNNTYQGFNSTTFAIQQSGGTRTGILGGNFIVDPSLYNGGDYTYAKYSSTTTGAYIMPVTAYQTGLATIDGITTTTATYDVDNGTNFSIAFAPSNNTLVNSLRFSNATSTASNQSATIGAGQTLVVNSGGILVTPLSASAAPTATRSGVISGGSLTAGVGNSFYNGYYGASTGIGGQLFVNQYNTALPFEISSSIVNNTVTAASSGTGTIKTATATANFGGYVVSVTSTLTNLAEGDSVTLPTAAGSVTGVIVATAAQSYGFTPGSDYQVYFATNPTASTTFVTTAGQTLSFSMNTPLVKSGPGTLILSGSNTYTGNTDIDQGVLRLENPNAIASGSLIAFEGGVLGIGTGYGSTSFTRSLGTFGAANAIQWNNNGGFASYGQNTTITIGTSATVLGWGSTTNTNTTSGGSFLPDGAMLLFGAADADGTVNFVNPIALDYGQRTVSVTHGSATVDAILSGALTDGTGANSQVGASSLVKEGNGILSLTGVNTYSGPTQVSNGTLILGYNTATSTAGSMTSELLTLGSTANTSGVFQLGDSNAANNTSFNGIYIAGTGSSNAIVGGNAAAVSTLTVNNGTGLVNSFGGQLGGSTAAQNNLALTKTGGGVLTLSGANTYGGATSIASGTLRAGVVSVAGTSGAFGNGSAVSLANVAGATLDLNGFDTQIGSLAGGGTTGGNVSLGSGHLTAGQDNSSTTFAGIISGNGAFTKIGSGTQILTGANTYLGGTTVTGGVLQGSTASLQGNITNNAAVSFNQSTNGTYANAISGSGGVSFDGSGTVTLTGANTFGGETNVNNGSLTLNNTSGQVLSSGITVGGAGNAATLNVVGNNSTGGHLIVNGDDGVGTLSLVDTSINSLNVGGNFTLGGASTKAQLNLELNTTGGFDSIALGSNAFTLGAAGATLTLSEIGIGALQAGTYNLITFGSTSGGSLVFGNGTTTTVFGSQILTLNNTGTVEMLTVANGNSAPLDAWFKGNISGSWAALPGGTASNFTTDPAGTTDAAAVPDSTTNVHFYADGANATNVANSTLDAAFTINSLTIDGSAHPVNPQGNAVGIFAGTGGSLTIVAGTSNGHTAGDGITINNGAGAVTISAPIALGATQSWTNNGSNGFTVAGSVDTAGFGLTLAGTGNDTLNADITGAGSLTQNTSGITTLGGNNSYTGGTTVSAGTLAGAAGTGLQGDIANNAAVNFNAGGTYAGNQTGSGTVEISSGNVAFSGTGNTYGGATTIDSGATLTGGPTNFSSSSAITDNGALAVTATGTMNQNITGSGSLTKTGAGVLTLGGTNSYGGGTTLSAGGLLGTTDSLQGDIATAATTSVTFSQTTDGMMSGNISGGGSFTKSGAGNVTLSGTNSYSGGTTVSAGTLTGTTDSLQGNIADAAALVFDQAGDGSYAGVLSGAGALTKNSAGAVTLGGSSNNTFNGAVSIAAGTLVLGKTAAKAYASAAGAPGNGGSISVGVNGTLQLGGTGNDQLTRWTPITNNGVFDLNGHSEDFGALTGSGTITSSVAGAASLSISHDGLTSDFTGTIEDGSGTVSISTNNHATLSGNNTYTGSTTVIYGVLFAGSDSTSTTGPFGVNSALVLGASSNNSGAVDLDGHNVSVGSLSGTGANVGGIALGSGRLTVGGDNTSPGNYVGAITGAGGVTKVGIGVLSLTGTSSYAGDTFVQNGTLQMGGSNTSSAITVGNTTTASLTPTLSGNGSVGSVHVLGVSGTSSAGTLSQLPTGSPLTMTSATLDDGSNVTAGAINTSTAAFVVTGNLELATGGTTTLGGLPSFNTSGNYLLFSYTSLTAPNTSLITSPDLASEFTLPTIPNGTLSIFASNDGMSAGFVELGVAVPEPTSMGFMFVAAGGLLARRRRRART